MRSSWLWPVIILFSALAATLVTVVIPSIVLRHAVIIWFLFACPSMVLVRFFHLRDVDAKWTLAVALSLSLDAITASIQLYAGLYAKLWSPSITLSVLIGFCVVGAIVQLACH